MTQESTLLEVCCGSITSALNAQEGGAHRIELCDNLNEGGTTPSAGTIIMAKKMLRIPVFVLIRPRTGDFLYSDVELEVMKKDIQFCKERRVEGVVFGILKEDGSVDSERMKELVALSRPMQVTFHRAFDMTCEPFKALEDIIHLGIERILTSGQASTALAGADLIQQLNNRAYNRIIIMPGGGITEHNVNELIAKTKVKEVHGSLRSRVIGKMQYRNDRSSVGSGSSNDYERMESDQERIRNVINSLRSCH